MSEVIRMKKMDLRPFISSLRNDNIKFRIRSTGYSNIVSYDINGFPVKRVLSDRTNFLLLGAFAKVKSAVQKSNKKVPYYTYPTFYSVGQDVKLHGNKSSFSSAPMFKKVLNIDIKSAYPTCLFNNGFLDKKTLRYLEKEVLQKLVENFSKYNKIPIKKINWEQMNSIRNRWKEIRLKSVGMLATRTLDVLFTPGRKKSKWKSTKLVEDNYLRSVFLFAQYEIGRVMTKIAKAYGKDFLFMWVDGIYVKHNAGTKKAEKILKEFNYRWSTTVLKDFKVWTEVTKGIEEDRKRGIRKKLGGKEIIKIDFIKDGKHKPFSVPTGKIARHW